MEDGRRIVSNIVSSQIELHRPYGGVVPEIASRAHIEKIVPVVRAALDNAGISAKRLDGIAVTQGPGLVGCLLVGISYARAMAYALNNMPIVGVHHLAGHLCAVQLEHTVEFPFLGLVASGGHTSLFRVEGIEKFTLIGKTRDDAAGEAFDKVAKLLGLGYPGGAIIEKLSREGDPNSFKFPRAFTGKEDLDFSFSGLKTAVSRVVSAADNFRVEDVAASFQQACVGAIVSKTIKAALREKLCRIVISGGVAANSKLRETMREKAAQDGIGVFHPSLPLCADNAAMIAAAGTPALQRGERAALDLDAVASWRLG